MLVLACGLLPMHPLLLAADEQPARSQLSRLLGSGSDTGFPKAIAPREFAFPEDHGPHPEYRNEWWYVTGNLDSDGGRRFGFELTFFCFALTAADAPEDSGWRSRQVYIAHFAVTDAGDERFYVAEKFSRGALGLAGADASPFHVWIDDWEILDVGDNASGDWRLRASDPGFALDVSVTATKPPVLNGIDGLSQKSSEPGNASYYYSITRLHTRGTLRIGEESFAVSGLSWLDREWGSSALSDHQQGWDWFALQLSDGSELMIYNIRQSDGRQDVHSAGTIVDRDGKFRYLDQEAFDIEFTDYWQSPHGGTYPSAWRLRVPGEGLDILVKPAIADQELSTTVRYWEGAVDVAGERSGAPLGGRGYVELTGYVE